jgi:ankyrin repeat protein
MKKPIRILFNYLIDDCKLPIDEIDNEGLNPVFIGIKTRMDCGKDTLGEAVKTLIKKGANYDLADR